MTIALFDTPREEERTVPCLFPKLKSPRDLCLISAKAAKNGSRSAGRRQWETPSLRVTMPSLLSATEVANCYA